MPDCTWDDAEKTCNDYEASPTPGPTTPGPAKSEPPTLEDTCAEKVKKDCKRSDDCLWRKGVCAKKIVAISTIKEMVAGDNGVMIRTTSPASVCVMSEASALVGSLIFAFMFFH